MGEFKIPPEFEEKIRQAVEVPNANSAFVQKLNAELARMPVRMKSRFVLKPAFVLTFAFAIVAIALIVSMPSVANALKSLFGYVPGVGLVENTGNLRMLAEPVVVTRDGVTLTIANVFVYADRVELTYDVQGVSAANDGGQSPDSATNPKAFCGGLEPGDAPSKQGNPVLRLPDGTLLERDATTKYPQNAFAMKPVYEAVVAPNVEEMTFLLDCIPHARRNAEPENWEVPFRLVSVPQNTVVGAPVVEVEPTTTQAIIHTPVETSNIPAPVVTMTLTRVVPMESRTIFYFKMNVENGDPSLVSIMPAYVSITDSFGQKMKLVGNFAWQPFEHPVGSEFEFTSQTNPAPGPLTLTVENAMAVYAPLSTDPQQATPDQMSFTFDAGENPQHGESWELNRELEVAGYQLKVTSAQAANFADIQVPGMIYVDGSQGFDYGYNFGVSADPSVKILVEMDIMSESPACWLMSPQPLVPDSSSIHYAQLCKDGYPKGNIKVTLRQLSVLVENSWQAIWTPK